MKKTLNVGLIGSGRLGSKYADGGPAPDVSTAIGRLLWAPAAHGNAIYSGIFLYKRWRRVSTTATRTCKA